MKSLTEESKYRNRKRSNEFQGNHRSGQKYGTKWYIVEQEYFEIPQLQSIEESLVYL